MLDRLVSFFKDIIIYLIPGMIIISCLLFIFDKMIFFNQKKDLPIFEAFIIFSFLVGFLTTQFQIIIYHIFNKNKTTFKSIIKNQNLLKKIIDSKLKLNSDNEIVGNDFDFRNFCYQHILNYANDKCNFIIHRADAFFLFSISLFLPSYLVIITVTISCEIDILFKIILFSSLFLLTTFTLTKATIHFQRDKELKIYKTFLAIYNNDNKVI